jgi:hypothetical protein
MEHSEIEEMIKNKDQSLLSPETMEQIEPAKFSFLEKYLKDKDNDVRDLVFGLLEAKAHIDNFDLFITGLEDKVRINSFFASRAIYKTCIPEKKEAVYNAIEWQNNNFKKEEDSVLEYLILSIGKVGDESDIEPLLALKQKERFEDNLTAYQKALAKLGYPIAIREIKKELLTGEAHEKEKAFKKVIYINKKQWIETVAPLLWDEQSCSTVEKGESIRYTRRVCDHAAETLMEIDPNYRGSFTAEDVIPLPFSDDQMEEIRNLYPKPEKQQE